MLWEYFFPAGTRKPHTDDGKMNETKYKTILEEKMLETAKDLRLWCKFTFQHDNNPEYNGMF